MVKNCQERGQKSDLGSSADPRIIATYLEIGGPGLPSLTRVLDFANIQLWSFEFLNLIYTPLVNFF